VGGVHGGLVGPSRVERAASVAAEANQQRWCLVTQLGMDFDAATLIVAPSPSVHARQTSAWAALRNLPRRGTQCAVLLELIMAAGDAGMSDEELHQASGILRQSICARRRDLRPFLTEAARRDEVHGMTCWRRKTAEEMAA
jgi:hypothetical protein